MYFKTERLEVKPLTEADEAAVIELLTDDAVKQTYMVPDFSSREEAAGLFRGLKQLSLTEGRYVGGICLGASLIGILNETEVSGSRIELGYAVLPNYHNHGYAAEALSGAIRFLFDHGFEEVAAGAFEENLASIRVMVKSGMTKLEQHDEIQYRGKNHNCVYYSARKEPFTAKK